MNFRSLKIDNLMGCNYEIDFDPRYTVIIGDNRQGKTLTARLIMLALYGTGQREKDLHDSWKLRPEELLPTSDKGWVELQFEKENKKYRICREFSKRSGNVKIYKENDGSWDMVCEKDNDAKTLLEDEIGITPGLVNVVMSNEQSLIGAVSYDEKLKASVWEGWKWRTEIMRGNIKKARERCAKERNNLRSEIDGLKVAVNSILERWLEKRIFLNHEAKKGIDKETLETKLNAIEKSIDKVTGKITHYSEFYKKLIELDDLEDKNTVEEIIRICGEKEEFLDEREDLGSLKTKCENYSSTLIKVLGKGGKEGIQNRIRELEDEGKKLNSAEGLKGRKEPIKAECNVYPPIDREKLVIQIPDEVATMFKYDEIASGVIAVPYDEEKVKRTNEEKEDLEKLVKKFEEEKSKLKEAKDSLRDKTGREQEQLSDHKTNLDGQKTILEADKDRYLENFGKIKEILVKRLDTAKNWFDKLFNALSEEESLKKIRKETVAFINRIYEKVYGWDINAKLEYEDKIIVTDDHGNIRSHPSGSETHIMGLAWRWMVARGFDLPLVLDELDILLDEKNFEKTKRLIEEEMDRQTVILTLREGLKDLPGKVYKMIRDGNTSTVVPLQP